MNWKSVWFFVCWNVWEVVSKFCVSWVRVCRGDVVGVNGEWLVVFCYLFVIIWWIFVRCVEW